MPPRGPSRATLIETVYHWSPIARRSRILEAGLRPVRSEALCCGATPAEAWELSEAIGPSGAWDLWQVTLADDDEVVVLPQWGPRVREVRVRGPIPADRCWLAGSRCGPLRWPPGSAAARRRETQGQ